MSKRVIYVILILLIALLLRFYVAFTTTELPADDGFEYDRLAMNVLSGRGYVGEEGLPTSFRPPFYPFALSAIYFIFGHSYLAVRIFQAILGTLAVLLFYLIGRDIHSEKVGIIVAFFAAIYPSYIILTKFLFTETLFTFLLALSVYLFLKMRKFLFAGTAALTGITLGILSLTRPSAILLPILYGIILFLSVKRNNRRKALYLAGIVALSCLIIVSPWVYRNTAVHGRFVLISSNGGLNFYQAVSPIRGKIFGKVPADGTIEESKKIPNEVEKDGFLFKKGIEKIINDPLRTAKLAVMRFGFYWGFFDWEIQKGKEYNYIYGFMLPFFILGFILALKKMKQFGILVSVIAYFFLLVLVSQGTVRYRLPTDGYLFMLSAYGISSILEKTKKKVLFLSSVLVYFLFNYFVFVNSEFTKTFLKNLMERIGLW